MPLDFEPHEAALYRTGYFLSTLQRMRCHGNAPRNEEDWLRRGAMHGTEGAVFLPLIPAELRTFVKTMAEPELEIIE